MSSFPFPRNVPSCTRSGVPHLDRLLFSAKESVYKTWYPVARCPLRFGDAFVRLHRNGTFDVDVTARGPLDTISGRWRVGSDLIVTAIALPPVPR